MQVGKSLFECKKYFFVLIFNLFQTTLEYISHAFLGSVPASISDSCAYAQFEELVCVYVYNQFLVPEMTTFS